MKKKIIIAIILIILFFLILIGVRSFQTVEEGMIFEEEYMDGEISPWEEEEDNTIKGQGTVTSFNIEKLETTIWSKVDKVLFNNEDIISSGQELLNVSNDDATGKIYSTVAGKIFIEENKLGNSYTIYDLDNLGYEIQVPEDKLKYLKIGQKVETKLIATNEVINGRICYISQISQDEQIRVKVKLENSDNIRIGYSVKAEVLLDEEIDENTPIYDIKNSIPKIGKTTIKYKTSNEEISYSSIEEMMGNDDIVSMYEEALEEQSAIIEELTAQLEELSNIDETPLPYEENEEIVDEEDISEKWETYWKNYYEKLYHENEDIISVRESERWREYWENKYQEYIDNNANGGSEE